MAHLVENMAYIGQEPWHGLGNKLPPNQSIDEWQRAAGMAWDIKSTEVLYSVADVGLHVKPFADGKVLYRSDTLAPLSVVGNRYKVVQPREVLEFYRDLVSAGGFELETAGVLKEGRKLWALAKTGQETILKGGDKVKAYLLLATSCDGTLATTAQFTSVRVVCNNTLQLAVGDRAGAVRVPHSTKFDPAAMKQELGLGMSAWHSFMTSIKTMAERKVNKFEAMNFLVDVLGDRDVPLAEQPNQKALQSVHSLFVGAGEGCGARGGFWNRLGPSERVHGVRRPHPPSTQPGLSP